MAVFKLLRADVTSGFHDSIYYWIRFKPSGSLVRTVAIKTSSVRRRMLTFRVVMHITITLTSFNVC